MENKNIITHAGLKELQEEYKKLVEIERPKVIQEIKEAREQGDLSENTEFDAAREKQGQIEDRISEIERIMNESQVIHSSTKKKNKVIIGSKVEVQINSIKYDFIIVGPLEADPINGKISNVSPLGSALLQHEKGDTVNYVVQTKQSQKTKKALILNIEN